MSDEALNSDKLYYSIGEVAKIIGTSQSQLRFWEKEFSILKIKKNQKGNRQFTKEDIHTLKMIRHLVKEQGYTLQGANDKLKNERKVEGKRVDVIDTLQQLKSFLVEIKEGL